MRIILTTFLALCFFAGLQAQTVRINDIREVQQAVRNATPGTEIVIANGIYENIRLVIHGTGTAERPIIVRAETPGQVILSGQSNLRLAGEFIEVQGLLFTNGYSPGGPVIEFRHGRYVANNSRITQSGIVSFNMPNRREQNHWIIMFGRNNRFDHNVLYGKSGLGVQLVVELNDVRHQQNYHSIDHNFFGRRPNLGSNGGETIRVGTSTWAHTSSRTTIENNFFEHVDGEVEIISIKSADNTIRNNTFFESVGVVALRHGDRNLVEGNAFFGNNKPFTGGVRVVNAGHIIRNNYFENLEGRRFFAGLAVMNSVPNSMPNRYHQVKDVQIYGNVWYNVRHIEFGTGSNAELNETPDNVLFADNTIINTNLTEPFVMLDDMSGISFRNNTMRTSDGRFSYRGFTQNRRATARNVAVNAIQRDQTGPSWFDKNSTRREIPAQTFITIQPGQNTLTDAINNSVENMVIELEEGVFWIDETIDIRHTLTIRAREGVTSRPVLRYNGRLSGRFFFRLHDDISFTMEGLWINGAVEPGSGAAAGGVTTAAPMRSTYSATFRNNRFSNFNGSTHNAFRAQMGSFADVIIFDNNSFDRIAGDAIFLAAETENRGTYNAEIIQITNNRFFSIVNAGVNVHRGGPDESTTGPQLHVEGNVFENVNNQERGSAVMAWGAQVVNILNNQFINAGAAGCVIRFDEAAWHIISVGDNNIYDSGRICSFWGNVVTGTITNDPPVRSIEGAL